VKFRPFAEAGEFAHKLGLKTREEWRNWARSGKKPDDIPSHPNDVYKNEGWTNWGDFLGYERTAYQNMEFLPLIF
jgi:hypothetical protein